MNILASTTRQWNPGDEFILFGVQRLWQQVHGPCNWMIYDRNPDLHGKANVLGNSWRGESLKGIDVIIIAGSPEWCGAPLARLFQATREAGKPVIFIGIGAGDYSIGFSELDQAVLRSSPLIVCRDKYAAREMRKIGCNPHVLPCPALFASEIGRTPTEVQRIGMTIQCPNVANQKIGQPLFEQTIELYHRLKRQYAVELIAHYKDEYLWALGEGLPIQYSFDARDYADIYAGYDAVVSSRVHGAILAAGIGIPSICTNPCSRATAATESFPILRLNPPDVPATLEEMDTAKTAQQLLDFKQRAWEQYRELPLTAPRIPNHTAQDLGTGG